MIGPIQALLRRAKWIGQVRGQGENVARVVFDNPEDAEATYGALIRLRDADPVEADAIAALIRKHVRLEWHGHDHANINFRSTEAAAEAIAGLLAEGTG